MLDAVGVKLEGPTRTVDRKLLHCKSRDQRSWVATEPSSQQVSHCTETTVRTVLFFPHDLISAAGSFVLQTPFVLMAKENIIPNCHVIFLYESVFCFISNMSSLSPTYLI
jgi:hypothetical protein